MKTSEPTRAPRRNHSGLAVLISLIGLVTGVGIPSPGSVHAQTGTVLRSFVPSPTGNGRAVAFDGGTTLYYTRLGDVNIYRATTSGASLGPIPLPEEGGRVQCGALAWDSTAQQLWCGSYNGTGNVYTVNPGTGFASLQFTHAFANDSCYGAEGEGASIDGLAFDLSDSTLWLSGDAARTLYHVTTAGGSIGVFSVPFYPGSESLGCNTGIAVAPGGFVELALQRGADLGPHVIVKVSKSDPSTVVDSFVALTTDTPGIEDVEFDGVTFAPKCAVWANRFGTDQPLTAYEVGCFVANQPPFFDPIADQFANPPLSVDQNVSISGVSSGPSSDVPGGQTVTLTATSDNPALIPNPTISGNPTEGNPAGAGSTRTLTYHRASSNSGSAMITVTAQDSGNTANGGQNTFSRTFEITVGAGAATAVNAAITNVNLTGGPLVTVAVAFAPIDFTGDGNPDCYFVFPPNPYNVIPSNATTVPEGPIVAVPGNLAQICAVAKTFSTTVDLRQWNPTPGDSVDFTYVNLVRDPELGPTGACPAGATCFSPIWTGVKPAGSVTFTTGNTVAVKNTVTLRKLDIVTGASSSTRLPNTPIRDFDLMNRDFQAAALGAVKTVVGSSQPTISFALLSTLLGKIFDADKGRIGTCVTDATGVCFAGQPAPAWDLIVVKFVDADRGQTVYVGDIKRPADFVNGTAVENIVITKLFKNGVFQGYTGGVLMRVE